MLRTCSVFMATLMLGGFAFAANPGTATPPSAIETQSRALERASNAVLGVQALALADARSNATLGRLRQGSGVVIGADGLVLTIGYLILEADQVQLVHGDDDRVVPARVVGYDLATGFGLLQALAPLRVAPVPLGGSRAVTPDEPLFIASGGENAAVSAARLVSRRAFAGYWEYRIDDALFTAPPRRDHSGAGLFNSRGELVGIGSLFVADALERSPAAGARVPGNMFVPVDLLRPILGELRTRGSTVASQRAWLGVSCVEQDGELRVARVSDDSPADVAGLKVGDRIVRIDTVAVDTLDQLWTRLWAGGAPEREVRLDIVRSGVAQTLSVQSVDRMKAIRRAAGI